MGLFNNILKFKEKSSKRKEEYNRYKELTDSYSKTKKEILKQIHYDN